MTSLDSQRVKELLLLPKFAHTTVVLGISDMFSSQGRPEVMFFLGSLKMSLADVWLTGRIVIGPWGRDVHFVHMSLEERFIPGSL